MLAVLVLMGFILSVAITAYFIIAKSPISRNTAPVVKKAVALANPQAPQVLPGLPARLTIPNINVNSTIRSVGLTSDGTMDITKAKEDVAWYKFGQRPGEIGSAVIAGHYGWRNNEAAAFDSLNKLQKGDRLQVIDDKGAIISFVVRESRDYDPKADASDIFTSKDNRSHLNLVTCEGTWNNTSKSYSKRLVVFTDRVKS